MSQGPSQSPRRLDSWKEIAAYLKHDLRTVERWEQERGLPVHRVPGNKRSAVFAFAEELDAWLSGQPLSGQTPAEENHREPAAEPRRMRSPVVWAGAAVILVFVALAAWSWRSRPESLPARARLEGNKLSVFDGAGQLLWEHAFPGSVHRFPPGTLLGDGPKLAEVVDLNRDGRPEVLVAVNYEGEARPTLALPELVCFSWDGKLLWRYQPSVAFRVGNRTYGDAWQIMDFVASPDAATPVAWVVLVGPTWGISAVARVDGVTGKGRLQFVNSGQLFAVNVVAAKGRRLLLAGGMNNEYDTASLAILDAEQEFAMSPQTPGSRHDCDGCPKGVPAKYILFPRSELNLLKMRDLHFAGLISIFSQVAEVSTFETSSVARKVYELSPEGDFAVTTARFSSTYWNLHRELETSGEIKHTAERCPDRLHPRPLRIWTPASGWIETALPPP